MIFPAEDRLYDSPKPTALYSATASACVANVWTTVNGWSVPRVYRSVEEEYHAAKTSAALFDLCPLARYSVRGEDAAAFLSRVTTAPATRLADGESARGLILDDDGGVIDLAEVSRLSTDLFLLTSSSRHARRIQLGRRGYDAEVDDISGDVAALGIFGPKAEAALSAAGLKIASQIEAGSAIVRGVETAARPIQFGALPGVELIFPKEEALTIWERLLRRGKVGVIGLDAMEILRLESGAPRPGVDFVYQPSFDHEEKPKGPAYIGLPHLAPLDRGWFNGRRNLRRQLHSPHARLITLAIDTDEVSLGAKVFSDGKEVGHLTSWAWSPAIKRVLAFAELFKLTRGNNYEISVGPAGGARISARRFETAEDSLASSFMNVQRAATESWR